MHVGESELTALVPVSESLVINAEQVQDRCLPIVNVDGVFDDIIAEVIRLPIGDAGFNTAANHPGAVGRTEVITAVPVFFGDIALDKDGAAEFTGKNNQSVVEQAALL